MKKALLYAILSLLVLIMVGCSKEDVAIIKENTVPSIEKEEAGDLRVSNIYSDGGCEAKGENAYMLQANPDGSYNIHIIDTKARLKTILCSSLSCNHDSEACGSWVPNAVGGCDIAVDDELYMFIRGYEEGEKLPIIYKMAFDGSDKRKIAEFGANQNIILPVAFDDKYMYLTLETANKKDGVTEISYELTKIDKATGKSSMLYRYNSQTNFLIGIMDNKFVMKKIQGAEHEIYVLNREGTDKKTITTYNRGEKQEVVSNGLKIVDLQAKAIFNIDKHDSLVAVSENLNMEINPKAFYIRNIGDSATIVETTIQNTEKLATKTYRYAIDFNSGEVKPIDITYDYYNEPKHVKILAEVQGYYLIISDVKIEHQQFTDPNGNLFTDDIGINQYSLITVEDYQNNIKNLIDIEQV